MAKIRTNMRVVNKHDTEDNWLKAKNFKPLAGEIIVYDEDELNDSPRFKIGNGVDFVNDLPFHENIDASDIVKETGIGCDWIYKKWSSGKCELSRNVTIENNEVDYISLSTPFLIINATPFVTVTCGNGTASLQNIETMEDYEKNTTVVVLSFSAGTIQKISIRIEGLWK